MNLYNLQQFKCVKCQHWFHPKNAQPYLLTCSHSVCSRCLISASNNSKLFFCPHHKSSIHISKLKLNSHVQSALQRLIKGINENEQQLNLFKPSVAAKTLQMLLKERYEDRHALAQLFERIYNNQIKRITHLKNRVLQQILGFQQQVANWKILAQNRMSLLDTIEEGKMISDKVSAFNKINFQEIANKVIQNTSIVLQAHFSIYDLLKVERKTLKSSINLFHDRFESNFSLLSAKDEKQNNFSSFINKTTQSPGQFKQIKYKNNNEIFCKELSSFKLDSSFNKQVNEQVLKNSKLIQQFKLSNSLLEEYDENGQVTLREHEHSKFSLKTKVNEKREQKRSQFAQLISSLKVQDQLVYSPEKSQDQMLLSQQKHQINFLQQCPIQRKQSKGDLQVRQKQILNVQREKNKYIRRMQGFRTDQAANSTSIVGNTLQLFNYDLKDVELKAFLDKFDWYSLQAIKLVGTGLQDHQFNILLNYLLNTRVHTVLLPSNQLQQISLDALVNFTALNSHLRTVSLQRNNIHPLQGNCRKKIAMLRQRGLNLYI